MRVPVADHRNVDVVGGAAAAHHGVELLPGFLTGHDAVHGVRGDTLGFVHGAGVTELHRGLDIVGGQGDGAAVLYVAHPHTTTTGQVEDGPPVTVFHPVGCSDTKSAVVGPGDDQVADAGPVAVGQLNLLARRTVGEALVPGALVEPADQLPGRSQHDRIETTAAVGLPAVEDGVEGGGGVADVDALPVQVEAERFGSAVADGEGGDGFGRVGEPVQLDEPERAVAGLDVTQYAAGADRGQLLIITDKPNTRRRD